MIIIAMKIIIAIMIIVIIGGACGSGSILYNDDFILSPPLYNTVIYQVTISMRDDYLAVKMPIPEGIFFFYS